MQALNGRFYAGRTISAETYDGVTKYEVQETEEELQKRLDDWERFISGEDDGEWVGRRIVACRMYDVGWYYTFPSHSLLMDI